MTSPQPVPDLQLVSVTTTNHDSSSDLEKIERAQIDQQLLNTLHTKLLVSKIETLAHKFTARSWKQLDLGLNLPSTVLAAISGTSALSDSNHFFAGVFGLAVAVLTATNTFLQPNSNSIEHLQFAAKYAALRNKIDWFLSQNSILENENNEKYRIAKQQDDSFTKEIKQFFENLIGEFNELEGKAPMPFKWAKIKAQNMILSRANSQSQSKQQEQSDSRQN